MGLTRLNVRIPQLSAVIKRQNKRICHIKTKNGDDDLMYSVDEKYVLKLHNKKNPALRLQGQVSANNKKGGG